MDDRAFWIALNHVPGVGPTRFAALLAACGSAEAAWRAPIRQLREAGLDRRTLENLLDARRRLDPAALLAGVEGAGVQAVTLDDADYPANLRRIPAPPPLLYLRGSLVPQDEVAVALVGTRRASPYGREVTRTLARELAGHGVTVVSGLALGIDTVAHEAAMEAGGRTLAVLGSGVDCIYPARNRSLARDIPAAGAVLSEYPLGTRPEARNFPPRNRIVSGLSRAVVVVEAGERSGALITAGFAADQGRDVFAVPGSILHPASAGCNRLIQDGAAPLLRVDDLLEQLELVRQSAPGAAPLPATLEDVESSLLAQLSARPVHIDDLARALALGASEASGILTLLELQGLVRQVGALRYVRA